MVGPVKSAVLCGLVLSVAACGGFRDSRLNPINWFGRSVEAPNNLDPEGGYAADDNRALVAEVTALEITRLPGGAIVNAVGLPPTQGWWDAELRADNLGLPDEEGVLTYRFVVASPRNPKPASTPQSREVTAGAYLSDIDLARITRIVVVGQSNSRAISR